jgi:hypothetical protein
VQEAQEYKKGKKFREACGDAFGIVEITVEGRRGGLLHSSPELKSYASPDGKFWSSPTKTLPALVFPTISPTLAPFSFIAGTRFLEPGVLNKRF